MFNEGIPIRTCYRILYLEGQEQDLERLSDLLKAEYIPCDITWVKGREAFQSALKGGWGFDLVLLGPAPGEDRTEAALDLVRQRYPEMPVIVLTAGSDPESAGRYLRQGATDAVAKASLHRLAPAVRRALKESRQLAALREAEAANARLVALLRTVLESTSEGVLVVDLAGKITTYNRKFMSLCGIPEYVMAPMELERVLQFLRDQFLDPEAFLNEARLLGGRTERSQARILRGRDESTVEASSRALRSDNELVGRVFSFTSVSGRERASFPAQDESVFPPDLLEAARTGRVVPWFLTEEDLVISEKGLKVLGTQPGGLPTDLEGLEALIHPDDLDLFRQGLEKPRQAPFDLRIQRGDGAWIRTRWNLKRGPDGYRGIFFEVDAPPGPAAEAPDTTVETGPQFQYKVKIQQAVHPL